MSRSNIKDFRCALFFTILSIIVHNTASLNIITCTNEDPYHPHPYKCSQYFECISGHFYLRKCEDTYEFDTRINKCVDAEDSNCRDLSSTTSTEDTRCADYEKYPHDTQCDRYYMCLSGDLYEMTCPAPLHFNALVKECDLPDVANCQIFTTTTIHACVDFSFYPHPYDCRKYYQCLNGVLYMHVCPEELAYNPAKETCDYRHLVECPAKPAVCENYRKYPHEIDCNKFYYCLNECLFLMGCHEDLHFNWNIQDCDLPENAMCEIETR